MIAILSIILSNAILIADSLTLQSAAVTI